MNLFERLELELRDLDEVISDCTRTIAASPEGSISIKIDRSKTRAVMSGEKGRRSVYLSIGKNPDLVRALCQKAYCKRMLRAALRQREVIERFLAAYNKDLNQTVFRCIRNMEPFIRKYRSVDQRIEGLDDDAVLMVSQMRQFCDDFLRLKGR